MVIFPKYTLLWVSKLQTDTYISTLYSEYVALYHSVRDLPPLKIVMKEVIYNLVIYSEKIEFVSRSIVYEKITVLYSWKQFQG